jgi:hypothetical protein
MGIALLFIDNSFPINLIISQDKETELRCSRHEYILQLVVVAGGVNETVI